jgi:cytoskeletal protein RodZ
VNDGFDDDPRDDDLARGLRGLAPSEFELDADQTLGSMRPALRRARVRRRLAVSTSVLGVLAVLSAGAVVVQDHSTSHVNIESHTPSSVPTPTKTPVSTSPGVSTTTKSPLTTTPTTRPTTTNGNGLVGPLPTSTSPPTTPTSHDDHGGTTTPPSTAPVPPATKTYTSIGGRVTIRFANGRLTLVSYTPSAGYTTEVHTNTPTDIELRFSNGGSESRIRVRVQDGQLRPEITEN